MAPKIKYSCRRRKDFVTSAAILMFCAIVLFELFLVFVLPILLSRRNAMREQVALQRMTALGDALRFQVLRSRGGNSLRDGEVLLVQGCLDQLAIYTRSNQEHLTPAQIDMLREIFLRFHNIADSWNHNIFRIRRVDFKPEPILKQIEKQLDLPEGNSKK